MWGSRGCGACISVLLWGLEFVHTEHLMQFQHSLLWWGWCHSGWFIVKMGVLLICMLHCSWWLMRSVIPFIKHITFSSMILLYVNKFRETANVKAPTHIHIHLLAITPVVFSYFLPSIYLRQMMIIFNVAFIIVAIIDKWALDVILLVLCRSFITRYRHHILPLALLRLLWILLVLLLLLLLILFMCRWLCLDNNPLRIAIIIKIAVILLIKMMLLISGCDVLS